MTEPRARIQTGGAPTVPGERHAVPDPRVLYSLEGKTAIVTGGSRGLGRAIAGGFAAAGANVVVTSRMLEACERAADEIRTGGARALAVACHMADPEAVSDLVGAAYAEFGRVDILVNNAAASPGAALVETTPELWSKTFAVNTLGPILLSSQCASRMREQGGGVVINVIAGAVFHPHRGLGLYCSSKAALHSLTTVMAIEWAPWNIRVNELCPGPFRTDMTQGVLRDPEQAAKLMDRLLIKRVASPDEVVGAALYLASDASGFATGSTVFVDGGYGL